jgi:NitT/TauT family transport system ATP-binding protein
VFDISLECAGVYHWFGSNKVLYDIDLKIARGQIVGLVGPSGCGKSTLLRAMLGTHPPRRGRILVDGRPVGGPGRDRGIVYQQYALFPFLTAQQNVAFGLMLDQTTFADRLLRRRRWRELRRRHLDEAAAILERYGLERALALYPHEMSGGMRQRVAIAQAIVMQPKVLLLDEPFGALDESTREELQVMLLRLYQENLTARSRGEPAPYTILIVTHELNEALYVSDRLVALSQHWDWRAEGLPEHPGATIAYDAVAPVYHPDDLREYEHFLEQRAEIRRAAFDESVCEPRSTHVRFWEQVARGESDGIVVHEP